MRPPFRVGHSYDAHHRSDDVNRVLVLGGVGFPGEPGLVGHSDADVVTHACIDAVLAAAGLGDIGQQFPDDDPDLEGADSVGLLGEAVRMVRAAGWEPVNIDCTLVADHPRLAAHRAEIERTLSLAAGAPVTVKGRRTE